MSKPIKIRFGVCACRPDYHGRFEGRFINAAGKTFVLRESIRSDKTEPIRELAQNLDVFFDLHEYRKPQRRFVADFTMLVPGNLIVDGHLVGDTFEKKPSPEEVLKSLVDRIDRMQDTWPNLLRPWLRRLLGSDH